MISGTRLVEDYAAARAVLQEDRFLTVDLAAYLRQLQGATGRDFSTLVHVAENTPFFMSGPRHERLHALSGQFLVAARLRPWLPMMETEVERNLDRLRDSSEPDLVRDLVDPLFRLVTGTILGFDATDKDRFDEWTVGARDLLEPVLSLRRTAVLQTTVKQMMEYIVRWPSHPPANSPPSVLDYFMERLSDDFTREDAIALIAVLFVAGQTTSQTLSNILFHLLRLPEAAQREMRGADSAAWFAANVETLLRLNASPQYVDRGATDDRMAGGCPFKAGDHLHIRIPSVNRDPSVFPDQDFCPASDRAASAGHLSFGSGSHRCPGATFARTMIGLVLPRLFARFPRLSLACAEPEWFENNFIRAVSSLPCTLS